MKNNTVSFFSGFLKGILVGVANIIPGVSGGTIAVVLGIFDELIDAINNFYKDFKRYFKFLLPVGLGAAFGIVAFSSLIEYSLTKYSFPTSMFFVGLVIGSIPLIYAKASEKKFRKEYAIPFVAALCIVAYLSLIKEPSGAADLAAATPSDMAYLFFGGAIAAAAMVIPGISGSFIMILLGLYPNVIHAIASLKLLLYSPTDINLITSIAVTLIPLGLGVIAGILLISKIISILLKKMYAPTYFAILGLVFGSVFGIFNDPITYQSGMSLPVMFAGVAALAAGCVISLRLGK